MGKEFVEQAPESEKVAPFPNADEMRKRMHDAQVQKGEEFRRNNPVFAERLKQLMESAPDDSVYVNNKPPKWSIRAVKTCLAGLGYQVIESQPMMDNDHGPFRISWHKEAD